MKNKNKLEKKIQDELNNIVANKRITKMFNTYVCKQFNVSLATMTDVVNKNCEITELSNDMLYWLMSGINHVSTKHDSISSIEVSTYFDEKEVQKYDAGVQLNNKDCYPVVFNNCLKVNEDQWVTVADVNMLATLNDNEVIRYNKNTQRNMTRKRANGQVFYAITLKEQSVNEICDLMERGEFISNDLTFNINLDDPNSDYEIRESENQIIITQGYIDIIDGYHRFRGMMKAKAKNPEFNYNMIINITNFNEEKAGRFIVQEDKRNKINSSYIKSLDSQNPSYMLVKRLNEDTTSYLYNCIGREDENDKITFSFLFNWIDKVYNITDRRQSIALTKTFKNLFNSLIEEEIIEAKQLDFKELGIIAVAQYLYGDNCIQTISERLKHIQELNKYDMSRCIVNKRSIEIITNFVKGDDTDV